MKPQRTPDPRTPVVACGKTRPALSRRGRRGLAASLVWGAVILLLFQTRPAGAINVYVLSSGHAENDARVKSVLEGFGYVVCVGVEAGQFNSGAMLEGSDAVLLLHNWNWASPMPNEGQTAIEQFVNGGGGLVTGEWVTYTEPARLGVALPATSSGAYSVRSLITYRANKPDGVLNANVPASFTFEADNIDGTELKLLPKAAAQVFYTNDYLHAGLVGWDYGKGRVLSFSTVIGPKELGGRNYGELLINALLWVLKQPPAAPDFGSALGGTWVVTSPGSLPGTWTFHARDSAGSWYTSMVQHAIEDPTIFGRFVEATARSELRGNVARISRNRYHGTHVAYGAKKTSESIGPQVVWISLLATQVTLEDPDTMAIAACESLFLPEQDADGDGLPDENEEPIECLEYAGTGTRVGLRAPCVPSQR